MDKLSINYTVCVDSSCKAI